ncbi:hypothetical protein [Flavobacterium sp. K5-23]|uniref:hypothetical protein n=1 Tax=Flavobacterium sp. K5-23 TaxID=2746225 RepID=UPI00200D22DD|nr:hypothetical protein [Flavobacterium sp. K5-23]UQD55504.1 hypothetical protein FLAK523_03480 [Flavobacterium sp. K5-23]
MLLISAVNLFASNLFAQHLSDTIFLLKENNGFERHEIFIEPNKNSDNYKDIIDFSSFPEISNKNKNRYKEIPSKWIPLYSYKMDYYVYSPCDFSTNQQVGIYDKAIFFNDFELYNYQINSSKESNNKCIIYYKGLENEKTKLEIFILDKKKGVTVFKYTRKNNEVDYRLMVVAENARLFPLIINKCINGKTKEFEFEKIDFENIIDSK